MAELVTKPHPESSQFPLLDLQFGISLHYFDAPLLVSISDFDDFLRSFSLLDLILHVFSSDFRVHFLYGRLVVHFSLGYVVMVHTYEARDLRVDCRSLYHRQSPHIRFHQIDSLQFIVKSKSGVCYRIPVFEKFYLLELSLRIIKKQLIRLCCKNQCLKIDKFIANDNPHFF